MAGPRMTSLPLEDLEQRAPVQLGMVVGLVEVAGHHAGAEADHAVVLDGRVAGEEPQEVALARAVGAEDGDPLAEPDLDVERVGQPGQLQPLDREGAAAGAATAEADGDALLLDPLGRRGSFVEVAEAALGGLGLRRERRRSTWPARFITRTISTSRSRSRSWSSSSCSWRSRRAWRASW